MGTLDGKVVLVTGTGGGLGRVAAQIFARKARRSSAPISRSTATTRLSNSFAPPAVR